MTKNLISFPLDKSHERNKKKEQLKYSQRTVPSNGIRMD